MPAAASSRSSPSNPVRLSDHKDNGEAEGYGDGDDDHDGDLDDDDAMWSCGTNFHFNSHVQCWTSWQFDALLRNVNVSPSDLPSLLLCGKKKSESIDRIFDVSLNISHRVQI